MNTKNKKTTDLLSIPGSLNMKHSHNKSNDYLMMITVDLNLADNILSSLNQDQKHLVAAMPIGKSPSNSFFMQATDAGEVESLIKPLHNDKAPGVDGFSNIFIKTNQSLIFQPLTTLIT